MRKTIMTLSLMLAAVMLIAATAQADAYGRPFGLGLVFGSPSGINGKYFFAADHAIDATVGFGFLGGNNFHTHVDYLYHLTLVDNADLRLRFYPGVGPSLEIHETNDNDDDEDAVRLAARVPLGLTFEIKYFARHNAPIDLFVEVAPGLRLYDHVGFAIDGGIGARYYF